MKQTRAHITALGFDFGMKRIGVAIGQTLTQTAQPLTVLSAKDGIPVWATIEQIIGDWGAQALIVGLPYQLDGSDQMISFAAKKFARRLKQRFQLPVHMVDERYTTKAARSHPDATVKLGELIDGHAAAIILESWLNQ